MFAVHAATRVRRCHGDDGDVSTAAAAGGSGTPGALSDEFTINSAGNKRRLRLAGGSNLESAISPSHCDFSAYKGIYFRTGGNVIIGTGEG